jgi:hypothetical protein
MSEVEIMALYEIIEPRRFVKHSVLTDIMINLFSSIMLIIYTPPQIITQVMT